MEKWGGFYTRCASCGFVYSNPRSNDPSVYNESNNEALGEGYIAKHYSKGHQARFARLLKSFAGYRSTGRLVEVGCNAGGFLFQAVKLGWDALGVEPVDAVARHGRERHGLNVITSTLEQAALPANSADVVFSHAVIEHLPSPKTLMREAARVLRPGGLFFADTVNFESYTQELIGAEWRLLDPRAHLSLFSPSTLRRFCAESQLKVRSIKTHGVRLRPNHQGRPKGAGWWLDELRKLPLSVAARFTLKGDGIVLMAEKPL